MSHPELLVSVTMQSQRSGAVRKMLSPSRHQRECRVVERRRRRQRERKVGMIMKMMMILVLSSPIHLKAVSVVSASQHCCRWQFSESGWIAKIRKIAQHRDRYKQDSLSRFIGDVEDDERMIFARRRRELIKKTVKCDKTKS